MTDATDPIRETDDAARTLARGLIETARFGALAVIDPETGAPMVSRVAVVPGPGGAPLSLVSMLSRHTRALGVRPDCSLLLGEPGPRGDPLTHPRVTLQCVARPADKKALKAHYLARYPKARLYYDFTDFGLIRLTVEQALLNGGFGKAYLLAAADLEP